VKALTLSLKLGERFEGAHSNLGETRGLNSQVTLRTWARNRSSLPVRYRFAQPFAETMRPTQQAILQEIADECYRIGGEAIVSTIRKHPGVSFFAAGFHTFYSDYAEFGGFRLGLGAEETPRRWSGCEWGASDWGDICDFPSYNTLASALEDQADEIWDQAQRQHEEQLSDVCRRLTSDARNGTGAFAECRQDSFLVGIFNDLEGNEQFDRLVEMSVDGNDIERFGITRGEQP